MLWRLGREGYGSRSVERAGELGEDRQDGVQPNPVQSPDAQRSERPFILETAELPLNGSAATIESREARSYVKGSSLVAGFSADAGHE
jgi:hypothetical protein